jgi:hypothetical protein
MKTRVTYFKEEVTETKATTPKNSCVQFLVKIVSVAQKLSTTEERCQDQVVCFEKEITETKARTLRNCSVFDFR